MPKHHIINKIAGLSISTLALSALVLSSSSSFADTTQTITLNLNVASVCTLSVNTLSHTATIDPGTAGLLGSSTLTAICNDNDGLAVYAVGFSGDSLGNNTLISTTNSSNTIPSATASSPTTSQWNMTLAAVSGDYAPTITNQTTGDNPVGDFTNPHIIPTVYTKVAYRNSYTDAGTNATGANFTASFNAYVGATQTAGTYQGKVKFLLTHPNVLSYDSQTGEPDEVQPFISFCEPGIPTPTLQDVANWGSTITLGETVDAMDSRDGQCYKVSRYKINAAGTETALWMSNLNLGAEPLKVDQLDSTNTNLASVVSPISASTLSSWVKTEKTSSHTEPGLIPITVSDSYNGSDADDAGNKYGTLYNFAAASAGTYAYPGGESTSDATSDLCPSGWRLPTGGSSGELKALIDANSITNNSTGAATLQFDFGFSFTGTAYDSFYGRYWSSTRSNGYSMYHLLISSLGVYPEDYDFRTDWDSIRCVAQ